MYKFKNYIIVSLTVCILFSDKLPNDIRWVVQSDEYKMLCNQIYHIAKEKLRKIVLTDDRHPNQAVIMDLDETILDNSQYQVEIFEKGETFNIDSWAKWVNRADADLVPGAKEYIDLVRQLGVQLIFISNRMDERLESTKVNMKKLGVYHDDDIYLLRLDKKDKKNIRRNEVFKGTNRMSAYGPFEVIMYLGDAMGDFEKTKFNNNFIFPNPMYGKW